MRRTIAHAGAALLGTLALAAAGCDDGEPPGHDHETEVITTVTLTLTPSAGGAPVTAAFSDPDGDGGMSGTADPLALSVATEYAMAITFSNALIDPPLDLTPEISDEAEDHQVFVHGDAVEGPATTTTGGLLVHAYADAESDYGADAVDGDLPVGLSNTITTGAAGTGSLSVMLRHMPPLGDQPQKTADLAAALAAGDPLPGDVDANVTFDVTVQ
jgi:hypothetical protein